MKGCAKNVKLLMIMAILFMANQLHAQIFSEHYTSYWVSGEDSIPLTVTVDFKVTDDSLHLASITKIKGLFTSLVLPDSVIYEGEMYVVDEVEDCAFVADDDQQNLIGIADDEMVLSSITFPKYLRVIGHRAFMNCRFLSEVILPDSLQQLGEYAFSSCENLISIRIPDAIRIIPEGLLMGCSGLKRIFLPQQMERIGERAFYRCLQLADVVLPDSLNMINDEAFGDCHSLTSLRLPNRISHLGAHLFQGCQQLELISLPDSIVTIPERLFSGCEKLREISIPATVSNIEPGAFENCKSLSSITIPQLVEVLGEHSFWGCDSLKIITVLSQIPPKIYSIDSYWEPDSCNENMIAAFSNFDAKLYVHGLVEDKYRNSSDWELFNIFPLKEISIGSLNLYSGDQRMFPVYIFGFQQIGSVCFDLVLPHWMNLIEQGNVLIDKHQHDVDRPNHGHVKRLDDEDNHSYHICVGAEEGDELASDTLITLVVAVDTLFEEKQAIGKMQNVMIRCLADEQIISLSDAQFDIHLDALKMGDVNFDAIVDVTDIMMIINYVLGNKIEVNPKVADINKDHHIDIVDIMLIVQKILND